MHFVLRYPCHFPHVPEHAFNVTDGRRFVPVRGYIEHSCDQGSHLTEGAETAMGPLGKVHSFLSAKQPFDESVELLTSDQRQIGEAFTRGGDIGTGQAKGCAPFLVPCQPVPQTYDERADQLFRRVARAKLR